MPVFSTINNFFLPSHLLASCWQLQPHTCRPGDVCIHPHYKEPFQAAIITAAVSKIHPEVHEISCFTEGQRTASQSLQLHLQNFVKGTVLSHNDEVLIAKWFNHNINDLLYILKKNKRYHHWLYDLVMSFFSLRKCYKNTNLMKAGNNCQN